ncbi:hypothetical protein AB0L44_38370 [Nonomuraea wenchangensis]|uniref:hypothetical protein n=1 Tax=Nonomuraea wenchangensis TaxID=568860 RepID=UPI00343A322D
MTVFSSISAAAPSASGRTLATAATTTSPAPSGAVTVTSTERASAAFPSRHTRAAGTTAASSLSLTPAKVSARSASHPAPGAGAGASASLSVIGRLPQLTDSAATGLAATTTRPPPKDIPLTRTRNRCVSPVRIHLPTPSWTASTRSSTSDTPLAATGTAGTAARITTPASIQPRRIAQLPRCDT